MSEALDQFITNSPEDLARALGELSRERMDNGAFLEALVRSKAFALVDRSGDQSGDEDAVRLMTVDDPQGEGRMMALFTSAGNAQALQAEAPDFEHLARVDVLWALLRLEKGCGVMVDPGRDPSFRIPPQVGESLQQSVRKAIENA